MISQSSNISIRRVLIYRIGSLGDTVVALPCFHLIERAFPQAQRHLLTNFPVHAKAPASAAVLGESGLVHGYLRYTAGTRNLLQLAAVAMAVRRFRPDVLIYLMPVRSLQTVRRDQLFFRLAGVRRIIGLPLEGGLKHPFDTSTGRFESEAHRLANCLRELGDAQPDSLPNWDLRLTAAEHEQARSAMAPLLLGGSSGDGPLIVCGPGTKMQAKDWGKENWRALLARINALYPNARLALVGAREDADTAAFVAADWRGPQVNLCGQLTPRQTAAVIATAQVFLGPDSGPMHLAASVGTPSVIAFSARGLPGVWFPAGGQHQIVYHQTHCYGCNLETCTAEARQCLTSISVDEMQIAVERVLRDSIHRRERTSPLGS